MRALPAGLQAKLDDGATTLCWCWRLQRKDGDVLGFTDHDRTLAFDGVTYLAASAGAAGALEQSTGFSVDMSAIAGVLESAAITEADLAGGAYDDADLHLYRVDWSDPALRVLMWRGFVGEVRRGETGFEAELRGLTSVLQRSIGRVVQRRCDARLGDERCKVDLDTSAHKGAGVVTDVVSARRFRASGLAAFASGWFSRGVVSWTSGANAGRSADVEAHRAEGGEAVFELLDRPGGDIAVADGFDVVAGCDKRWRSCRDKFDNVPNFRGFPMTPGDDWVLAGPHASDANDGGSLWTDRDG